MLLFSPIQTSDSLKGADETNPHTDGLCPHSFPKTKVTNFKSNYPMNLSFSAQSFSQRILAGKKNPFEKQTSSRPAAEAQCAQTCVSEKAWSMPLLSPLHGRPPSPPSPPHTPPSGGRGRGWFCPSAKPRGKWMASRGLAEPQSKRPHCSGRKTKVLHHRLEKGHSPSVRNAPHPPIPPTCVPSWRDTCGYVLPLYHVGDHRVQ